MAAPPPPPPYLCPAGIDCQSLNACPSRTAPCPEGWLCGSFADSPERVALDLAMAKLKKRFSSSEVTAANAAQYLTPGRIVTNACPQGFTCPSATAIVPCPPGTWCPESQVAPLPCDALSLCGQRASYQLSPIAAIIAAIVTVLITVFAVRQSRRQAEAERETRAAASSASAASPMSPQQSDAATQPGLTVELTSSSLFSSKIAVTSAVKIQTRVGTGPAFSFADLGVSAPSPGDDAPVQILRGCSGSLPAARLSAIMGPTACGKSILLKTLRQAGGAPPFPDALVEGRVRATLGGRPIEGRELARRVGFVPQEDVLDRSLTVRELLAFNARARVGRSLSHDDAAVIVDRVLADLGIAGVADTVIGGGDNAAANISGGQLKRVNIACELVALDLSGAAVLLDEPTSGLDAAIANELCGTLQRLARDGTTVCVVLQQPRPEIFARVDHLVLMQAGSVVFEGQSADAAPYMRGLGFAQSPDTSDADFCVDVLNGLVPRNDRAEGQDAPLLPVLLADVWLQREHAATDAVSVADASTATATAATATVSAAIESSSYLDAVCDFAHACVLNAERAFVSRLRDSSALYTLVLLAIVMAGALSTGFTVFLQGTYRNTLDVPVVTSMVDYCPGPLREYCAQRNQLDLGLAQLLFFISISIGSAASLSAVPLFGGTASLARREALAGLSPLAFAVGRMTADTVFVLWNGALFVGVWMLFGHAGHWWSWFGVVLPTVWASSGIGYVMAASTRPVNARVVSLISVTVMSVFSGVEPQLARVLGTPIVNLLWLLSFATWTSESTYITWSGYMSGAQRARMLDGAAFFGFDVANGQARSIAVLVALGLAWRALAALVVVRRALA